jgi:FAD/FMN-containing dehydrogenase
MLGGGYGFTSLMYGMNCDNAVEAVVALADGSLVIASETENPDLFWGAHAESCGNS